MIVSLSHHRTSHWNAAGQHLRDLKVKSRSHKKNVLYIWVYVDVGAGTVVDDSSDHNNVITKMTDDVDNVGGLEGGYWGGTCKRST